jgi:hypothetical protein
MKFLVPLALLLCLFLPVGTSLMAQGDSINAPELPPNAEVPHAYFSLGDHRELPFKLIADENIQQGYRYDFNFEPHWKGSQVFARFSGMPGGYTLLINQFKLSTVKDGRTPVAFNITPFLSHNSNSLELVFDSTTPRPPDRFSESTLCFREPVHIRDMEISTYTLPEDESTLLRIQLFLHSYQTGGKLNRTIAMTIADSSGQTVFRAKKVLNAPLAFRQESEFSFEGTLANPIPWGPAHPHLYQVQLHLVEHGMMRGELLESTFGIRTAVWADSLLILNGDTIVPAIAEPGQVKKIAAMEDEDILALFDKNNYNAMISDTLLPVRIMNLFDQNGILVLRKQKHFGTSSFRQDRNRPSVISIE